MLKKMVALFEVDINEIIGITDPPEAKVKSWSKWEEKFEYTVFTEEEVSKLIEYATFLLGQRGK